MAFGDKPFGLRDVKLTDVTGTTQVDLPASRTLSFEERVKSGELSGDDRIVAVVASAEAVEWSPEAYTLLPGRMATTAGTTPNQTTTLAGQAGDVFLYFKIYGKAIGEGSDDIHCKLFKAKVMDIEDSFQEGEFWVTACSGVAVDDGANGISEFVQNETAADLPGS